FVPLVESIADKLETVKSYVIMTDDTMPETKLTDIEYEEMLRKASPDYEFPDFDENTMATLFYTSGTTGRPKGVWFTHRKLVLHTLGAGLNFAGRNTPARLMPDDVYMPLTPMFHVHAWGKPYIATVLGIKQVYPGRYDPKKIIHLIKKEGVTISHCVPTVLQTILDALPEEEKLSGWKVEVGGAKLTEKLILKAQEKGVRVISGYGLSETCPAIAATVFLPHLSLDEEERIEYTVKTGFPGILVYVRVIHDDFTDVKPDEKDMGEIVVRAPWLTDTYLKDPEKT
ncbi:AMP-binding protein, partial [Archaeoglobus neptunius]|uniref:AMP-binding protein n=1 Tax=Archaeoglobus neptunius TaxID=2798580 RepID=UPI001928B8BE